MVFAGDCKKVETRDTWVHLALNLVATTLLASSNYCMQLLSAPNRSEVDKAHRKQKWLDIGIPSVRNLRHINKKKAIMWWTLGVSSIPLHLLYNSVFYSALATNNYSILYASQDFVQNGPYDRTKFPDSSDLNITAIQQNSNHNYTFLDNEDCIKAYARDYVENHRNVIVIVKNPPSDQGSLFKIAENEFPPVINNSYNPFKWICDNPNIANQTDTCCPNEFGWIPCSKMAPKLEKIADQWSSGGFEVDHCLVEPVQSECHLHFSLPLICIVLGFNLFKVVGIGYVTFYLGESPLVTGGDALQSFLRHPDPTTEGMCLASNASIIASSQLGYKSMPMRYDPQQQRMYEAATWKQWAFLFGIFSFAGVGTAICLGAGINGFKGDRTIQNAFSIGLGNVRPQNLVMGWHLPGTGNTSVIFSTLIANSPQAIFSFLYMCYNSLFTVMFHTRELLRFSITAGRGKKYLRVSSPRGEQKSTYFLSLPYRYAIPLLASSGLMHWLVSQSVFLANIAIIPRDGTVPMQDEITTVAYSPMGMLFMLLLGFAMLLFLLFIATRKLPFGMPLMGSNSMAISAACQLPPGYDKENRENMVLRPLNWGAVPSAGKVLDLGITTRDGPLHNSGDLDENGHDIGHCCFGEKMLELPQRGKYYI
jgi:hypothetical protein